MTSGSTARPGGSGGAEPASAGRNARPRLVTRDFLGVGLCGVFFFFASGMTMPVLPRVITDDLRGGDASVGIIVGMMAVSSILIRPWAPRFGESWGLKRTVLTGALLAAVSFIGYGVAPELVSLSVFRLLTGLGQALFLVSAVTLVTGIAAPERRGEAVSYFSIAPWLGIGVGPLLGETAVQLGGTRVACLAAGTLALLGAVVTLRLPDRVTDPDQEEEPGQEQDLRRSIAPRFQRSAFGPGTVLALGMFGSVAFSAYLPLYTREIGAGGSQYVFLTYGAVILLVRLLGGRIPDRLGGARAGTLATVLIVAGLTAIALFPVNAALYCGTVVFSMGIALQYPALLAFTVNRVPPRERSTAVATFTMFFDVATGLGGAVLGLVSAFGGYRAIFFWGAGCALLGLLLLHTWAIPRRGAPLPSAG